MKQQIVWHQVSIAFFKADKPQVGAYGRVRHYNKSAGGQKYDGGECGMLELIDLDNPAKVTRIMLDKPRLIDLVEAADPKPDDLIGIKYLGERQSAKGHTYKDFEVFVGRPTLREVDFSDK